MRTPNITTLIAVLISVGLFAQTDAIDEEKFVSIGGIGQWITLKGDDRSKPVVLFIHGGPGSTLSPYADTIYGSWKKDYVLVNWDQRGAGKTFGHNAPSEINEDYFLNTPLTVEQMTKDGIELTKYLLGYLDQQKIIVIGTSWGSILGMQMVLDSPELYEAYIGHAQFVNFSRNMEYAYNKAFELAQKAGDTSSLELLETLGSPPYDNARSYGQLLRTVKKYENANAVPAPASWWKLAPRYDNERDAKARYDGDDYSFINFVGHDKLGIPSMVSDIDLERDAVVIQIPVYLIQGEVDILSAKAINRPYFEKIKAPRKEYILLPNAAHGFNQAVVDTQLEVVKKISVHQKR